MQIGRNKIIGLTVLFLLETGLANASRTERRAYDGETLFRGLFLAQGPVARLFPEVWQHPLLTEYTAKLQQPSIVNATAVLIKLLRDKDPAFFSHFAADVQSGDPVLIDSAIRRTIELSQTVAEEQLANAKQNIRTGTSDPRLAALTASYGAGRLKGDCVVVTFIAIVAAVVDAVAVVQVVAVVELEKVAIVADNYAFVSNTAAIKDQYYVIPIVLSPSSSALARDEFAAMVANRLELSAH